MHVLGISAFYHDSAAALIEDGAIIAAAEEERFSRIKHDNVFPGRAILSCLESAGIRVQELDAIAYYERPLRKFERILEMFADTYPRALEPFVAGVPEWLSTKLNVERAIRDLGYQGTIRFIPHHLSHAASAFYTSPFDEAAILTVDGVGEYQTTALWKGSGADITELASISFPHSLGLLYSTLTAFLGFRVNDDEYKVMGLAGHGSPAFIGELRKLVTSHGDGSFSLDMRYFSFRESFRMWSDELESLLGPPRAPGSPIGSRERDLAASVQLLMEEIYFRLLQRLHEQTGVQDVCIGGGVALNATANGKIFSNTPFRRAFIPGPAGDSGAAAGAALFAYHSVYGNEGRVALASLSLGPSYDDEVILREIEERNLPHARYRSDIELVDAVAEQLADGNVIGWFQGKMEFGPRALGNRSIIADPRRLSMKDRLNRMKDRHDFHPFAASVLEGKASEYFEIPADMRSPFMTFCFPVRDEKRKLLEAVTHADGTCRIQTVSPSLRLWHSLISAFERRSGLACILDTSFNGKGEPIVESPAQAIDDFLRMDMDALAIGRFIIQKERMV